MYTSTLLAINLMHMKYQIRRPNINLRCKFKPRLLATGGILERNWDQNLNLLRAIHSLTANLNPPPPPPIVSWT